MEQPRHGARVRPGTTEDGQRFPSTQLSAGARSIEAELGLQRTLAKFGAIREPEPVAIGEDERYAILRTLGRGAMGTVYLAFDARLEREVAIKVVSSRLRGRPHFQSRLQAEASTLAALSHPNVLTVHDVQRADSGELFIDMEYVDGSNLRDWRASEAPSKAEILAVLIAAGRGLEAAHRRGLVHRDFKPDNVLLSADGRVRVADFGLAVDEVVNSSGYVGTRGYMSPEQRSGAAVDARSDQYSFCVTLWELLVGQLPESDPSVRPRELPRWIHARLVRGLDPDRERRYPSMGALLDTLERTPLRRRWSLSLAGAALVGGLAASALTSPGTEPTDNTCAAVDDELARVWGPAQRRAVAEHLGPDGPAITASLDELAEQWRSTSLEACGEGRRVVCQDRWLERFERRVALLAELSPEQQPAATAMVEALRRESWCALTQEPLRADIEVGLDRAEIAMSLGDYARAESIASHTLAASETASGCGSAGLHSREAAAALLRLAEIEGERHDAGSALARLDAARIHARACVDEFLLAAIELRRIKIIASDMSDAVRAREEFEFTRALLDRSAELPDELRVQRDLTSGLVELVAGNHEIARLALEQARSSLEDQPLLELEALINMASAAVDGGEFDVARALFAEADRVSRSIHGHPPELDIMTLNRGIAALAEGEALLEARALLQAAASSRHPSVRMAAMAQLLDVEWRLGNRSRLVPLARELVDVVGRHPEQPAADRAHALTWAGQMLADQSQHEGLGALERALDVYETELDDPSGQALCELTLAVNALEFEEFDRARELHARLATREVELDGPAQQFYAALVDGLERVESEN